MFALYITHPQVAIDPAVPVPDWGLSERGRERARFAASAGWARQVGRLVASTERKAIETAKILAAGRLAVETDDAMGENDRSATGYLPPGQQPNPPYVQWVLPPAPAGAPTTTPPAN